MYHRGKFDNVKVHENTIEAYRAAMEEKCPIELDVRLTGDGERSSLVAPLWSIKKFEVLNAIDKTLLLRNTSQGIKTSK